MSVIEPKLESCVIGIYRNGVKISETHEHFGVEKLADIKPRACPTAIICEVAPRPPVRKQKKLDYIEACGTFEIPTHRDEGLPQQIATKEERLAALEKAKEVVESWMIRTSGVIGRLGHHQEDRLLAEIANGLAEYKAGG
ncbi:MAG: hypothetical protein ACRDHZ_00135 [Ktedonobacteraceae bacterium]